MRFLTVALGIAATFGLAALLTAPMVPAERGASWPEQGSRVEYALATSFTAPDGSYQRSSTARLVLSFDGTSWSGVCEATVAETVDGVTTTTMTSEAYGGAPAVAPGGARRGADLVLPLLSDSGVAEACRQGPLAVEVAGKERREAGWADARGRPVHVSAWTGQEPADGMPRDLGAAWEARTGVVLDWSFAAPGRSWSGELVASDAFR